MHDLLMIDGLQYSHWNEEIFRQMQAGGLSAVHATIAYHENARKPCRASANGTGASKPGPS